MLWLLSGCLLGGLGALLKYWQWPFAMWASLAGGAILVLGFLNWLNALGGDTKRATSHAGDAWSGSSPDFSCHDNGDCGGGDGGGGGD
ncbi:MAG: hypothetical protein GC183_04120 [Thiobacillus sp.]|nr:hypothetical protein [Thiobacillus sp.]